VSTSDFSAFIQLLTQKLEHDSWQKLLLSSYQGEDSSLVRIEVRPVVLKDVAHLSFYTGIKPEISPKTLP